MKFENIHAPRYSFGGSKLTSSPKEKRPIDTKSATHLVLKAYGGVLRLNKTICPVNREIERVCKKYGFTLYKYSNNHNHLHLLLRITHRYLWAGFIRELTGRIAQIVKDLLRVDVQFWLGRPFTRILKGWGRNYRRAKEYVELNIIEAVRNLTKAEARAYRSFVREFGSP